MDDLSPPFLPFQSDCSRLSPPEASPFGGFNSLFPADPFVRARRSADRVFDPRPRPTSPPAAVAALRPFPVYEPSTDQPSEPKIPIKLETTGLTSHAQLQFRRLVTEAHASTVVAKLRLAGLDDLAGKIADCGSRDIYLVCKGCSTLRVVHNHCDNNVCPKCQPSLARRRYEEIAFWAKAITQPKHVVLTIRNQPWIDAGSFKFLSSSFARLRRRAFARGWKSGIWSIEVTNEGKGWHLHLHALIDAKWIDAPRLAREWASVVGQDFSIVKVMDARAKSYLKEVTKYCVKGSELAGWEPAQIKDFVLAVQKARTFGTFGALYKRRSEMNAALAALRADRGRCECGCNEWKAMSSDEYFAMFCTYLPPPKAKASPSRQTEMSLFSVNSFNQPC